MLNASPSQLDQIQIFQRAFDSADDAIRIDIAAVDPSVIVPVIATLSIPSVGSVAAPIPTSADLAGFKDPSGNLQPGNLDSSGNLKVTVEGVTIEMGTVSTIQGTTPWITQDTNLPAFAAKTASNFITAAFDYAAITYVASGNGVGQIQTVVYKLGGSGGTTVGTLTLAYNSSNQLISVTKS
jgi:hypothetical protein